MNQHESPLVTKKSAPDQLQKKLTVSVFLTMKTVWLTQFLTSILRLLYLILKNHWPTYLRLLPEVLTTTTYF